MIVNGRRTMQSVSVWPGYVDALSALLMVVIFVLMIFTVVQFMLSEILTGQESELARLNRSIAAITRQLGLERERSGALSADVARLSARIDTLTGDKASLEDQVAGLTEQSARHRATIEQKLLLIASMQEDIDALRRVREALEARVGELAATLTDRDTEIGTLRDRSKGLEARLADERERTVLAQKEIESRDIRIQALDAVVGRQKKALADQRRLTADARSEMALLNEQLNALKTQLEEISRALAVAEADKMAQRARIEALGKRLNIALAREVNELRKYRSAFFGRLREVLSDTPFVRIEGDRFVFQAELLFPSGSAQLQENGKQHMRKLAAVLRDVAGQIPVDIDWILRIDGHTDRRPIRTERFPSNWELSTARAVTVLRFLAAQGIPENRMAATGFSKFHPLDPDDSPEAFRRNRRIEIKLTSR
jgi:chemotaxis protein MotB